MDSLTFPPSPPPSRPNSMSVSSVDIPTGGVALDTDALDKYKTMANSSTLPKEPPTPGADVPTDQVARLHPSSQYEALRLSPADHERYLFVPGLITLARSNEDSEPLNVAEIVQITSKTMYDVYKEITPLPASERTQDMVAQLYPRVEKVINEYWLNHSIFTMELDLIRISGWNGSQDGKQVWLQLTTKFKDCRLLKQMAKQVHQVVIHCKYPDIHCVIFEDSYELYNSGDVTSTLRPRIAFESADIKAHPLLGLFTDDMRYYSFVSGSGIGAYSEGSIEQRGTIGAYLTNGESVIGVTCSHVVGNQDSQSREEYLHPQAKQEKRYVQLPDDKKHNEIVESLGNSIKTYQKALEKLSNNDDKVTAKVQQFNGIKNQVEKLRDNVKTHYSERYQRCIGHTLWASGINSTNASEEKFSKDVGIVLIELQPGVTASNQLPVLGDVQMIDKQLALGQGGSPAFSLQTLDDPWLEFGLAKPVTEDFIKYPPSQYQDKAGEPAVPVIMTGRVSGTKAGFLYPGTTRRAHPACAGKPECFVQEYVVRGVKGAFSECGDSGAMCLIPGDDGSPMILGLVTGGSSMTDRLDKSYIYPWFHFADTVLPNLIERGILAPGPSNWTMDMSSYKGSAVENQE